MWVYNKIKNDADNVYPYDTTTLGIVREKYTKSNYNLQVIGNI